jgi:hypothetical protein
LVSFGFFLVAQTKKKIKKKKKKKKKKRPVTHLLVLIYSNSLGRFRT